MTVQEFDMQKVLIIFCYFFSLRKLHMAGGDCIFFQHFPYGCLRHLPVRTNVARIENICVSIRVPTMEYTDILL